MNQSSASNRIISKITPVYYERLIMFTQIIIYI